MTQLGGPADPLDEVVRDDGVRIAALVVLQRLTPEQRRVLDAFLAALAGGDLAALVELLHPDATVIGDGGGKERTARRPVRGADKVARFILGLLERYGPEQLGAARLVLVNGDLGMVMPPWPGDAEHPTLAARVSCFAIRDGQLAAIYDMVNPDKIGHTFGL